MKLCRSRNSLYTPKVEETNGQPNGEWRSYPSGTQRAVSIDNISMCYDTPAQPMRAPSEAKLSSDHCNGKNVEDDDFKHFCKYTNEIFSHNDDFASYFYLYESKFFNSSFCRFKSACISIM